MMILARNVARMGKRDTNLGFWWEIEKEKDYSED
jgi:hypothetical protein